VIEEIRRATRRQVAAEETIRTVLEGRRGEAGVAEPCRRAGIAGSMYGGRSRAFREAGSRRPAGDAARADTADEVLDLRHQTGALRAVSADLRLENRLLKGGLIAAGGEEARGGRPREAGDHRLVAQSRRPVRAIPGKLGTTSGAT
jgi:transposase